MRINEQEVIGIEIPNEEEYFRMNGCDNCANGLGCEVVDVKVYTEKTKRDDHYAMKLCNSCLCGFYNGDFLDVECENIFEI